MLFTGVAFLVVGLLWSAFKGYVVWDITHDLYNGGSAPTLDFPVFCPMPLAYGTSLVLISLERYPFSGFGFLLYLGLACAFGLIYWLFDRLGEPERKRQLEMLQQQFPHDETEENQLTPA
jgi:hypothetical protein